MHFIFFLLPLQLCIVIQEIYLDGIVAMDGRLRPGDQILEVSAPT